MGAFVLIAARNLLQARRRTALLSTALGLVSLLLVMLMAGFCGIGVTVGSSPPPVRDVQSRPAWVTSRASTRAGSLVKPPPPMASR